MTDGHAPHATIDACEDDAAARRASFLLHLAATGDVARSAGAVGATGDAVQRWREDDPAFAALWRQAIDAGYETLETRLLASAIGANDRDARDRDTAGDTRVAFDPDLALRVLARRDRAAKGEKSARTGTDMAATLDAAATEIEQRLIAIERRLRQEGEA